MTAYCTFKAVSLPSNVDKGGSFFIGMMGLEKSNQAMKNICSKLTGYYSFGDPNDQVLKNNMPLFMETFDLHFKVMVINVHLLQLHASPL